MGAVSLFQKAITLYRNNGESGQAEKAQKRLVEIQKEIPKNMVPHSIQLNVENVVENIKTNMEDLNFEESIMRLTQMIVFEEKKAIKNRVVERQKQFPLLNMFPTNIINSEGQTIFTLPALDVQNPERDPELLELYMHQDEL